MNKKNPPYRHEGWKILVWLMLFLLIEMLLAPIGMNCFGKIRRYSPQGVVYSGCLRELWSDDNVNLLISFCGHISDCDLEVPSRTIYREFLAKHFVLISYPQTESFWHLILPHRGVILFALTRVCNSRSSRLDCILPLATHLTRSSIASCFRPHQVERATIIMQE